MTVAILLLLQFVTVLATLYSLLADLYGSPWPTDGQSDLINALAIARIVLAAIVVPLAIYVMTGICKGANRDRDYLQVDEDGLLYMRRGESRYWAWRALPAFKPINSFRQIQFVLPGPGTIAEKRDPWIHEMTPDGPVVAISDIYDTPFDEIATTLNEYRDRALAARVES
ncbi:MAG: hypothetical protein HKM95_14660 [Inquilinus sp.]|nr:hypothetical protein [Inquilinus sp.]